MGQKRNLLSGSSLAYKMPNDWDQGQDQKQVDQASERIKCETKDPKHDQNDSYF